MQSVPYLSLAIWTPIVFGILLHRVGSHSHAPFARWFALLGSVVSLLLTVPLIEGFDAQAPGMQFVESYSWLSAFNITWRLGIDGISLWLVVLTAFTNFVIVLSSWKTVTSRVSQYYSAFLILTGLLTGVFSTLDGMLFFIFFEATLIPFYLLIGTWGHARRAHAAVKYFFISFAGSIFMLMAMLYLYGLSHTFDLRVWHELPLSMTAQILIFIGFFAAFAVKVPMWPLHTWLPDAHVEAPTGGSIILAAIMLKLGAYGFLRFSLPVTPDAAHFFAPFIIFLSLVAIVYIGLVALVQTDMKKLVAYSSIAHMGFVTLGFFMFNQMGMEGAIVQMISHGLVSGAMFFCIGVLYDRLHSREISDYGGVVTVMPKFAAFALLFAMANCGLPGTSGFVGEFMVILASVQYNFWIACGAAFTLILGAGYTLWMYKRVYFGPVLSDKVAKLGDLGKREFGVLVVFAGLTLLMGVYPKPFTDVMHVSVQNLLSQVAQSKLPLAN